MERNREVIVDNFPKPSRIQVMRRGMVQWIEIEPTHPRFGMSMDKVIKRILSEEDRFNLAEDLAVHVHEALSHWSDEPLHLYVPKFDLHLDLSDNPDQPGKMLVRFSNP